MYDVMFFFPLKLDIVTSSEGATEIPSLVTRYLRLSDWFRNLFGAELKWVTLTKHFIQTCN